MNFSLKFFFEFLIEFFYKGASFIASAYASELLVSLLHHPLKQGAPSADEAKDMSSTGLGILPQHIRGNISDFETRTLYGRAFEKYDKTQ